MKKLVGGTAILLAAFAAGILFQRTFTVGKSIRWALSVFHPDPGPVVAVTEPVTGAVDWTRYREVLEPIDLERNDRSFSNETLAGLRSRSADESRFRASEEVERAYRDLLEAKKENGITAMEIRRNRFLRMEELEYQSDDASRRAHWEKRTEAILDFHGYLKKRGIHLIFMPVPNQADLELPGLIGAAEYLSSSPAHTAFLISLAEAGVDVIDLRYEFGRRMMNGENMINRFDHHWSPQGVELGAEQLARRIQTLFGGIPRKAPLPFDFSTVYIEEPVINFPHRSVGMKGSPLFARQVTLHEQPLESFPGSRILILGDSMVISYGPPHSADVSSHLSARLGYPCRVIGSGSGSPLVPKMFLENYGADKSADDPDVVIWICVSRHQDYSVLNTTEIVPAGNLKPGIYEVTVRHRSNIPDPKTAPYSEAIYAMEVTIQHPGASAMEARVYAPAFESRLLSDTADVETGKRYRMELIPWQRARRNDPSLAKLTLIDDFDDFSLPVFYWAGE